jgi:hypothetical protein
MRLTAMIRLAVFSLAFALGAAEARAAVTPVVGPPIVGVPSLWVQGYTTPPYVIVKNCTAGEGAAIVFRLIVRNYGKGASPANTDYHAIWVRDSANSAWGGGNALPAIPVNNGIEVDVPLVALKDASAMQGHHVFNASFQQFGGNTMAIPVDFPPSFCPPTVSVAPASAATPAPVRTPNPYAVVQHLATGLPAPTNLTNTITQGVCAAHGGPAGSLACYIGLPAGKLVLVWDYPFPDKIDGYRIYLHGGGGPSTPSNVLQQQTVGAKPLATQSDPSVHLIVLDPPGVGTCFDVTAFAGDKESSRSATSFCVSQSTVGKSTTLNPSGIGTLDMTVGVDPNLSVTDNMYKNSNSFSKSASKGLTVGEEHDVSLTNGGKPSEYTNIGHRGYVYFYLGGLAGHVVASAHLNLRGGVTTGPTDGTECLVWYGAADHNWNPGDLLGISGTKYGGSAYQGQDLSLDVTPIVQSWAKSPNSNTGFALEGDQPTQLSSYGMVLMDETCKTTFSSTTLDVTYY